MMSRPGLKVDNAKVEFVNHNLMARLVKGPRYRKDKLLLEALIQKAKRKASRPQFMNPQCLVNPENRPLSHSLSNTKSSSLDSGPSAPDIKGEKEEEEVVSTPGPSLRSKLLQDLKSASLASRRSACDNGEKEEDEAVCTTTSGECHAKFGSDIPHSHGDGFCSHSNTDLMMDTDDDTRNS